MSALFKNKSFYVLIPFCIAEAVMYIVFLALGQTRDLLFMRYSAILLCLATSLILILFNGADAAIVGAAFVFTSISDLLIFVLPSYTSDTMPLFLGGLCTFILTQCCYFARIYLTVGKKPFISIAVRIGVAAVLLIAFGASDMLDPLVGLCSVYFPMLVINTIECIMLVKISKRYILFFAGLLLFVGCDICVGLFNLAELGVTISAQARELLAYLIWVFYLPSQTLIVLSTRKTQIPRLKQ